MSRPPIRRQVYPMENVRNTILIVASAVRHPCRGIASVLSQVLDALTPETASVLSKRLSDKVNPFETEFYSIYHTFLRRRGPLRVRERGDRYTHK